MKTFGQQIMCRNYSESEELREQELADAIEAAEKARSEPAPVEAK